MKQEKKIPLQREGLGECPENGEKEQIQLYEGQITS